MKIVVNTRLLLDKNLEGIGRVADELLKRLVRLMPEAEFHFAFDRKYNPKFIYDENVIPHVLFPQSRHPLLHYLFFEYAIPYLINKTGADLYLSPEPYLPLRSPTKKIVIFHDLAYEHFPEGIGKVNLWHLKYFFPKYAQNADKIISVSNYTKQDIVKRYKVPEEKITVAYNGISEIFAPLPLEEQEKVRQKYTNGYPYFIYVGSIHPRKNVSNLLRAFDLFKDRTSAPHKLLLTGRLAWKVGETLSAYKEMKYKQEVIFSGYVSDEELAKLYASAYSLCYVSVFEGFGLPIVEAMKSGTAVICSDTSSMKEIGNNSALLVNPYSVEEIANAMMKILDVELRESLIERSKEHIKKFSWDNFAIATKKLIEEVM